MRVSFSSPTVRMLASALIVLVVLAFFSPPFWLWSYAGYRLPEVMTYPELNRAYFLLKQAEHPWQPMDPEGRLSNLVLEWRLLPPLLAHYLHLSKGVFLSLPFLGCFVTAGYITNILQQRVRDVRLVLSGLVILCASSWLFISTSWLGYFDAWLIFLLLVCSFSSSPWAIGIAALLAPWIDERFILAIPVVWAARRLIVDQETKASTERWGRPMLALLAGITPYILIRLGVELGGHRDTTSGYHLGSYVAGFWQNGASSAVRGLVHGLRCGGLFLLYLGHLLLPKNSSRAHWLMLGGVAASLAVTFAVAADLSRSVAILCPLVLCGFLLAAREHEKRLGWLAPVLAVATLLLPAKHVVTTFETPIQNVVTEAKLYDSRREALSAEYFNLAGAEFLKQGRPSMAHYYFDAAILIDPNYAPAYVRKGMLLFDEQHPVEALEMFDRALLLNPTLLPARLYRARARQAQGQTAGAREDWLEILRLAPVNSPIRAEAEREAQRLGLLPPGPP